MPYLGNTPSTSFATVVKDSFSGDGSTVAFTLSKVATTNSVSVFVENVRQEPTTAYAVSGTTLTFTAAPVTSSGNNIYVLHMNPTTTTTHPAAQNLTAVDGTFTGTVTAGSTLDMNGTELILDADADTSITADTDDRIDFKTGGTDRLQVQSTSGNNVVIADGLTLTDGNLVVASGHGISFAATANLGSALATNNELFEDYEEGTWTPAISISSSDVVEATNSTKDYRKIGDVVFISAHIVLDGAIPDGAFTITGLPTAIGGRGAFTITAQDASSSYVAFDNIPTALVDESGQDITCDTKGTAYASSDRINISGFYFTSTG